VKFIITHRTVAKQNAYITPKESTLSTIRNNAVRLSKITQWHTTQLILYKILFPIILIIVEKRPIIESPKLIAQYQAIIFSK
jgi:hypothetical protein